MKQTHKTAIQFKKLLAYIILGLAGALSPNYPVLVICGLVFVLALEFSLPVDYRFIIKKSLFFENKSLSTEKSILTGLFLLYFCLLVILRIYILKF
jgi:hypothetical protein